MTSAVRPQPTARSTTSAAHRILAAAAAVALLVAPAAGAVEAPATPSSTTAACSGTLRTFPDVRGTVYYATPVTWMACRGISTGYGDGTFRPAADVSRAETALFLYRMVGATHRADRPPFRDVSGTATNAISWFATKGISTGYRDGTFRPQASVTRGEFATFLHRLADPAGYTPPTRSPFRDVATTSPYYRGVTWMKANGLANGYADGTFGLNKPISRGEAATLLHRFAERILGQDVSVPAPAPTVALSTRTLADGTRQMTAKNTGSATQTVTLFEVQTGTTSGVLSGYELQFPALTWAAMEEAQNSQLASLKASGVPVTVGAWAMPRDHNFSATHMGWWGYVDLGWVTTMGDSRPITVTLKPGQSLTSAAFTPEQLGSPGSIEYWNSLSWSVGGKTTTVSAPKQ